jgi:hypothetical protein
LGSLLGCSLAAILLASSGAGSQAVETTIQDDAVLLHRTDVQVHRAAAQMKALGADRVRLTAGWSVLAPGAQSRTKPGAPFDPSDSSTYPQAGFRALDRAVEASRDAGLDVQIDIAFWAPRWAVKRRSPQPERQRFIPNPVDFAAFAKAVAARYSGHFSDPRHHVGRLPAVRLFTTWNEPNYATFLAPQWVRTKHGYRPYSPLVYRAMHEAAYAAIKSVTQRDKVLIGGLSSTGSAVPGRDGVPPLEFLRTMACVNRKLAPLHVPECRHPGVLHADGFAMHPYSVDVAPGIRAPDRDDVYLADLGRLDDLLAKLYRRGRTNAAWPVFVTEYGYETKPPDPTAQYTPEQQARYVGWSTYLAQSDPHVKMFAQFLLRDVNLSHPQGFNDYQTGLFYANGQAKPAAQAFKIPFFASYATTPDGSPGLVLYGGVRPGTGRQIVRVERRAPGSTQWLPVQTAGSSCDQDSTEFFTDDTGFFRRTATWEGPGDYRLGWDHGNRIEYGAIIPVDAAPLIAIAPPASSTLLADGT